jgi:OmpA-OmpF porin, OOP family
MKTKYLAVAFAIAAASFALPTVAQVSAPSVSSAYVGGSLGQAELDLDCEGASCEKKDTTWRVFGGYQFHRHFSAELGYANLGEARVDFGPGDQFTAEARAWDISAVGILPVGPVSLIGRLGLYRANTELRDSASGESADDNNSGLLIGLGVQYDVTKNLGVRAEWQQYADVGHGDTEFDVRVINLGVVWKFQ